MFLMLSSKDALYGDVVNTVATDLFPLVLERCSIIGGGEISQGVIKLFIAALLMLATGSSSVFAASV